jgi:hypothetical protein
VTLRQHPSGSYSHDGDPGEPSTGAPRLSVTAEEASILTALFHNMTAVEFGTGLGVSTRAIAASASRLYTVDVDPWVRSEVWPTLPSNVVRCADRDKLPKAVDGAFIDADHSAEAKAEDVKCSLERAMLLLVVHDWNSGHVSDGAQSVTDGWLHIPTTHGLGVKWLN